MGNQNPVALLAAPVNAAQSFLDALLADPNIYQQAGVIASYVNTVAAASAGLAILHRFIICSHPSLDLKIGMGHIFIVI